MERRNSRRKDRLELFQTTQRRVALTGKQTLLEDVWNDGQILVLSDGRRFAVADADDATNASIWVASARMALQLRRGCTALVTNVDTGETVSARELLSR
jgi:hypothetical protein